MHGKKSLFSGCLLLAALLAGALCLGGTGSAWAQKPDQVQIAETYGSLPLNFLENRGQVDACVKFYAQAAGHNLFFTREGLTLSIPAPAQAGGKSGLPAVVRLTPLGLNRGLALVAQNPAPGRFHYFLGDDPRNWHLNLPAYAEVRYRDAYPGIDFRFYGRGRQLEYDVVIRPGARPAQAKFLLTGIEDLKLNSQGDLEMRLPGGGLLTQKKPLVYQDVNGQRLSREGKFTIRREGAWFVYGFEVAAYDARHPLIIDPTIAYSTYLGGANSDSGAAIAVDPAGNAYIAGTTNSPDFPTKNPFQRRNLGTTNAFVTKLNASGDLVFSTYLGGTGAETGRGIALDAADPPHVFVTGSTTSVNFPLKNPFQSNPRGPQDAFVTRLNPNGDGLVYSTFLGGSAIDAAAGIAVNNGEAFVTGTTNSTDFPVKNAFNPLNLGGNTAFVTRFDANGGVVYSTYLGGSKEDSGSGIAVDAAGNAFVTGTTDSTDFPLKNAFQSLILGQNAAFVTRFNTSGKIVYSTYLGGSQTNSGSGIAVDAADNAYITGTTTSTDFPTKKAFQLLNLGGSSAFVAKFKPNGSLFYSTYLGGSLQDSGNAIAVDAAGNAAVTGATTSTDFPLKKAVQPLNFGDSSAFVARFKVKGGLLFSSYLGGSQQDSGNGVAVDAAGTVYITGTTSSGDFPVKNAFQPKKFGTANAFVAKISP